MGNEGKGKFKVGDRVVGDFGLGAIERIDRSRLPYLVRFDKYFGAGFVLDGYGFWQCDHDLRFPSRAIPASPTIVAVIENGTPKPNARPRIHDTEASATTEAERLAKLNPGQTFGVFVQTTARVADVTVRVA